MRGSRELPLLWFLVLAAGGTEHVYGPGRRVCAMEVQGPASESFVQRVYQPFLTTCAGHRACSTYRTIYRTAYRRSPGLAPAGPRYACCPGWKRTGGLPGACEAAICQPPCRNGGHCAQPGRCRCPAGWKGDTCQTGLLVCSCRRGRMQHGRGRLSPALCQHGGQLLVSVLGGTEPVCRWDALPAQGRGLQDGPGPDRSRRCGAGGGAQAAVAGGRAGAGDTAARTPPG
ncbi:PREDICTED: epidermal growth factor-like protein 7 isoform X5 [Dipodomys ordii]|uniref:Epidermal growth factor-like protein 7 n=1 Tax=Dipodomys ordii TaxID=10020 RepID=A0A1S3G9H6_DIPOR|nr:PREDICTED: epidermal growth factor-like protein 7 isoform X5 [Dipodomys ordii]